MFNCAAYYVDGIIKGAKVEDIGDFIRELCLWRSRSSKVEPPLEKIVEPEPMSPAARWREP
jgi:hypothetical protein